MDGVLTKTDILIDKGEEMKKIVGIFSLLIISLITFCSCGETKKTPQEQHTTHTYSTIWSKNETKHWKECSCGAKTEENTHTFGEWEIIESATTTKKGLKEQTCSVCSYKKQEKIPMVSPAYEWKSIDILQPTMIVGGISKVVLDENEQKQNFVDLVDRQLSMLAQEIISRLEYVYGNTNENKTHTITDKLHNNSTFTTYQSINAISEPLSNQPKYVVYNNKNKQEDSMGYIMMRNGEKVVYDETLHTHYITLNNTKYAAVCEANMAGIFTSETALQATFEGLNKPTITHEENSYDHEGILTFQGAIYGTPVWEYSEKTVGNSSSYITYTFKLNDNSSTSMWNWASDFENSKAKDKLKSYLAYILANNVTNYNSLPNESIIINNESVYQANLNQIRSLSNYISTLQEKNNTLLKDLMIHRVIGDAAYANDQLAGQTADQIAHAIYITSQNVRSSQSSLYYENGVFKQLYENSFTSIRLQAINDNTNYNFSILDFITARNYKAYDLVINNVLRLVGQQSAYLACKPVYYETMSTTQKATVNTNDTNIYLFLKTTSSKDIRLDLGVPYATGVTLTDKNGKNVSYTKENVNGSLSIRIKGKDLPTIATAPTNVDSIQGYGATTSLEELLQNKDYLHLTIEGVESFTLSTEEYVQIN